MDIQKAKESIVALSRAIRITGEPLQVYNIKGLPETLEFLIKELDKKDKEIEFLKYENTSLINTQNMCPALRTSGISCGYKDMARKGGGH